MKIAYITSTKSGEIDQLLAGVAERLQARGTSLAGIVKAMDYSPGFANGCDMKVRVLPDGPVIKITQNLGTGSDACRLDPSAIARAVGSVETGALEKADLFILNKFGPEEAAGRGFCNVIGAALEQNIPVLVGVSGVGKPAFETFASGLATALPAEQQAILDWCQDQTAKVA